MILEVNLEMNFEDKISKRHDFEFNIIIIFSKKILVFLQNVLYFS